MLFDAVEEMRVMGLEITLFDASEKMMRRGLEVRFGLYVVCANTAIAEATAIQRKNSAIQRFCI